MAPKGVKSAWDKEKITRFIRDHTTHHTRLLLVSLLDAVERRNVSIASRDSSLVDRLLQLDPEQIVWSGAVSRGELETYAIREGLGCVNPGIPRNQLAERIINYWRLRRPRKPPSPVDWDAEPGQFSPPNKRKKKVDKCKDNRPKQQGPQSVRRRGANGAPRATSSAPRAGESFQSAWERAHMNSGTSERQPQRKPEKAKTGRRPAQEGYKRPDLLPKKSVKAKSQGRKDQSSDLVKVPDIFYPVRAKYLQSDWSESEEDKVALIVNGEVVKVEGDSAAGKRKKEQLELRRLARNIEFQELAGSLGREYTDSEDERVGVVPPLESDSDEPQVVGVRLHAGPPPDELKALTLAELEGELGPLSADSDDSTAAVSDSPLTRVTKRLPTREEAEREGIVPQSHALERAPARESDEREDGRRIWIDRLQERVHRSSDIASLDLSNPRLRPEEPLIPASNPSLDGQIAQITEDLSRLVVEGEKVPESVNRGEDSDYSPISLETSEEEDSRAEVARKRE